MGMGSVINCCGDARLAVGAVAAASPAHTSGRGALAQEADQWLAALLEDLGSVHGCEGRGVVKC